MQRGLAFGLALFSSYPIPFPLMKTIQITDIHFQDRQRKKFSQEAIEELAASILANGIIHPPSVRTDPCTDDIILVAGERRIRAMELIIKSGRCITHGDQTCPAGEIPLTELGVLSAEAAFEAELDENIKRENLTWQERAEAESRLFEIRSQQNAAANLPRPTLSSIATEVLQRQTGTSAIATGAQITSVAARIRLADHLDDPVIAKAKTEQEALKLVRKKQETLRIQVLAEAFDASASGDCLHTLLTGDARQQLRTIPSDSVDCLLTDPPYGIDANTFGEQSSTGHNYADSEEYFNQLMENLAEESYRVCKERAHAYVFCDPRRFSDLQTHFELAGWEVWPISLIWNKGNGMLPRPEHAPRRTYECIMFAIKGNKHVRAVKADVISIPSVRDLKHGAQKPVELYTDLLSRSTTPGDTILDPFAGSGTIFPAANRAKCIAIGIELNSENANICLSRMAGEEDTIPGLEEMEI